MGASGPLRGRLEWVALRSAPDRDHVTAFEAAHKGWPAADWMRDMQEGWRYSERSKQDQPSTHRRAATGDGRAGTC